MPRLFYAYAHGCGDVLVKRGTITRTELQAVRGQLRRRGSVLAGKNVFSAAIKRITSAARAQRRSITPAFIREYFLNRHNPTVVRQAKKKKDVKPRECWITPARIVSVRGNTARAETPFGARTINIGFISNCRTGSLVSTHYGFACERVPKKAFERLWRQLS